MIADAYFFKIPLKTKKRKERLASKNRGGSDFCSFIENGLCFFQKGDVSPGREDSIITITINYNDNNDNDNNSNNNNDTQ